MIVNPSDLKGPKQSIENSPKRFYRPELDALRFSAFFLVFIAHTVPSPDGPGLEPRLIRSIRFTGSLGVPVFFFLSAYLITELVLRERSLTGKVDIPAFYARRILRIWPLYFLMLFGSYVLQLFYPPQEMSGYALASYVFLGGNWYTLLTNNWLPFGALPLWSIGIEEQFYLVWPTLLKYADRRTIFTASVVIWGACQVALAIMCSHHVKIQPVIWLNSFTHFQYFSIGSIVSVALNGRVPTFRGATRGLLVVSGIAALFISEFHFEVISVGLAASRLIIPGYILVGVGTSSLFLAFLGAKISGANPLVRLGKISYGLYVYHLICVEVSIGLSERLLHMQHGRIFVAYGVGLPLTVAVSTLSYRYFETPFLKLKERLTIVNSRPV